MLAGYRRFCPECRLKRGDDMKETMERLTPKQQLLVEQHLSVVHWVIIDHIHVNEGIYGLGYDDLYQEGCIYLCRAAVSYHDSQSIFSTYARSVVRNGLISYCRSTSRNQRHFSRLEVGERGELLADGELLQYGSFSNGDSSMAETLALLETTKNEYQGIARLGIEALALQIQGYRITDIAAVYQVPSSHVGAWISRSKKKLRNNQRFIAELLH